MDFEIPYELRELVNTLKKFIDKEVRPLQQKHEDENGEVPEEIRKQVRMRSRELSFYGADFPENFGGMGLSQLGMALLREEIGKSGVYLAEETFGQNGALQNILLECKGDQIDKYLLPSVRAEKIACFALTEPNAGSDTSSIETSAIKDGDDFILNGRKHFISNAPQADFAIVFAATDKKLRAKGGITAFLIDKGTPGFSLGRVQKHMGGGNRLGELIFEDCRIPSSSVLGEVGMGFLLAMKRVGYGRLRLAAGFMGMADFAIRLAIDYSKQRVQFGQPISSFQFIRGMLADMSVDIHASRLMIYHTAWKADQGMDVTRESGMVKLHASEMLCRVADRSLQIHGGMGYMKDCPIEGVYRHVRASTIGEGTSEVQRLIIASRLLKEGPVYL